MSTIQSTDKVLSLEKREKLEEYEPVVNRILKDGERLEQSDLETNRKEYMEMEAAEKFQVLTEFYNEKRTGNAYSFDEMVEQVEYLLEKPEGLKSSQKDKRGSYPLESKSIQESFEETEYPKVSTDLKSSSNTGSPGDEDLRKVVRKLETGNEGEWIKYTGLEKS